MPKADHPTPEQYAHAAWLLDVEPEAIQAFAEVEAGTHGAFLDSGEPVILFERHVFHRRTSGAFREATVTIDGRRYALSAQAPGDYGPVSHQHAKLSAAVRLGHEAALRSCSWGLFQIMGFNHERAGFAKLQDFVNAMYADVGWHLRAFVMFVRSDPKLVEAIRAKDWPTVARLYNGTAYKINRYDEKMAAAYRRLRA